MPGGLFVRYDGPLRAFDRDHSESGLFGLMDLFEFLATNQHLLVFDRFETRMLICKSL